MKIFQNLKNMDNQITDYLKLILQENFSADAKVYSLGQLKKSRRYLTDQIESR